MFMEDYVHLITLCCNSTQCHGSPWCLVFHYLILSVASLWDIQAVSYNSWHWCEPLCFAFWTLPSFSFIDVIFNWISLFCPWLNFGSFGLCFWITLLTLAVCLFHYFWMVWYFLFIIIFVTIFLLSFHTH